MVEPIAAGTYLLHPFAVKGPLLLGIRDPDGSDCRLLPLAVVFDVERAALGTGLRVADDLHLKRAPLHELDDVLDLDVVGPQLLDVAEQMLGQRPAVGIARHAALGPRVVRAFERRPEHDLRVGVLHALGGRVDLQGTEVERADVLGEVAGMRMVGRVRQNRVGVVVHAGDHPGALPPVKACTLNTRRSASGPAEQVDVEEFGRHITPVCFVRSRPPRTPAR